jgi:hypothetical protein
VLPGLPSTYYYLEYCAFSLYEFQHTTYSVANFYLGTISMVCITLVTWCNFILPSTNIRNIGNISSLCSDFSDLEIMLYEKFL